jgi:hypothetical protein
MKIANIPLSIPMPKQSTEIGLDSLNLSKKILKVIDLADDNIKMLETAFKNFPQTDPEKIWGSRKFLRNYRDGVIENYAEAKLASFKFLNKISYFESDLELQKIIDSFIGAIGDLNDLLDSFTDAFDNMKDKDFITNITKLIGNIIKQSSTIKDIIDERIFSYINTNILDNNWYNDLKNK